MTPSPGPSRGVPLAHKNNMGLSTSRTWACCPVTRPKFFYLKKNFGFKEKNLS
jgi:hypothetical protein